MAKNASGAAFINNKKKLDERIHAKESGIEVDEHDEDVFQLQHHHLLNCLEKTTVGILQNRRDSDVIAEVAIAEVVSV